MNCSIPVINRRQKAFNNTEGAIKNGQSRETGNIGVDCTQVTRRRQTKLKHNTLCVTHHYDYVRCLLLVVTHVLHTTMTMLDVCCLWLHMCYTPL